MEVESTKKTFSLSQSIIYTSIILIALLLFLFIVLEIGLRIFTVPDPYSDRTNYDTELGWVPKAHYSAEYTILDKKENERNVLFSTGKNGFREWKYASDNPKHVLFIGDSYTQAVEVSNDETFYRKLADSLQISVSAFGQAGYGTTQQYLIIKKYLKEINPDLIVLQTCDNDFIDNEVSLEYNSNYRVGLPRPYMDQKGNIEMKDPTNQISGWLKNSKAWKMLYSKWKYGVKNVYQDPSEKLIAEKKEEYEPYYTAIQNTKSAVSEIKQLTKDIPIIMFSSSLFEPQLSDFETIASTLDIPFYDEPARQIESVKYDRIVTSVDKYHWVEEGHKIVADALTPIIKTYL